MIQAQLVLSMHGKLHLEHNRETCKRDNVWYIFEEGPSFRTTWRVTFYDEHGLAWLQQHCKEARGYKRTS